MKSGSLIAILILMMSSPFTSEAAIPSVYTNENYWNSEHDRPVSFIQDTLGNFSGITVTGKHFTQNNIANIYGIKLHKFMIDEAFFYITDRGVITAQSDIAALSIYLAKPTA